MKRVSWNDIIHSDKKCIYLIGYGSLLNTNTHHADHDLTPVVFHGFRRIYNLKAIPDKPTQEWLDFFQKYLKKYNINSEIEFNNFIKSQKCVLNCEYTGNHDDLVNGLCMKIEAKDFLDYSIREKSYDLMETSFYPICPHSGNKTSKEKSGYVLVAQDHAITNNGEIFNEYHQNTRNGAYEIGEYFGKLFDETTYDLDKTLIRKKSF